jgi:hypothetical protein
MISSGLLLIGIGALLQAHLHSASDWSALLAGQLVAGVGVGLAIPILASAALASVPPVRAGMAAGAVTTARQLGYALGIAGLGLICQSRISSSLSAAGHKLASEAAPSITAGQVEAFVRTVPAPQRGELTAAIAGSFASGLNATLLAAGITGLVAASIVAVALRPRSAEPATPDVHIDGNSREEDAAGDDLLVERVDVE